MPILANVLLETKENRLTLSATDLDVGVRTECDCETTTEGSITIPARALSDMVRVLPGPDVSLKRLNNNQIEVKSGRTKARLMGMSSEEYPALPNYDDVEFTKIDARLFSDMVEKTLYAASTDETRYNLNGILLEPSSTEAGQIMMVATDGHRLVSIERKFQDAQFPKRETSTILPRKGIGELKRLLDGNKNDSNDSQLEIGFRENHCVVRYGDTELGMRLIDGTFPDYRQVIPKLADKVVRISRSDTVNSLRRVSVLASDKMQPIKLSLTKDSLVVSCTNPDAGEIHDDVPVEYAGDEIEVAFNGRYLIDALASLDDQNILLKLTDSLSPGLVVGVDESHHQCVVMPMRL